jgi:beta-lactamase regulating signal transducer with metallopeptidase domain
MTFLELLIITALASFAAMFAVGNAFVPLLWRLRPADAAAADRASWLFWTRVLPMASGLFVMCLSMVAFAVFEPRGNNNETAGIALRVLAALGFIFLAFTIARLLHCGRRTRRTLKKWIVADRRIALPGLAIPAFVIDARFPIVALAGVIRPKLFVARSVLEACPEQEFAAVLAHEHAHLSRWDNLLRAITAAVPNLLARFPFSVRIDEALHAAIEEAADDIVVSQDPAMRQPLAEALVRVARLVPADDYDSGLPVTVLFGGGGLEHRVRRLVETHDVAANSNTGRYSLIVALSVIVASISSLHVIHEMIEVAIRYLP